MATKKVLAAIAALSTVALAGTACGSGASEDFPSKSIEVIVPWGAGGSSDVIVRAITGPLKEELGESVLVVNRPGGGSSIGAAEAARAKADGYTMLHSTASTFVTVPLRQKVKYTPEDFRSVISLGDQPIVLVASPKSGWKSLADIKAKKNEDLKIATTSVGNVLHLIASNAVDEAGFTSEALPFDSSSETAQAVSNGDADLAAVEANVALPQIKAGAVVPLAISSNERLDELSDVPTFEEEGFKRSAGRYSRVAISVPADTPDDVAEKLMKAGEKALESQAWKDYAKETLLQEPEYKGKDFLEKYIPGEIEWTRDSFPAAGLEVKD